MHKFSFSIHRVVLRKRFSKRVPILDLSEPAWICFSGNCLEITKFREDLGWKPLDWFQRTKCVKLINPYPRSHALTRIWPFLAITHFHAFTVSPQLRILTQNVSLGTFQSSITRSSLITRRIEVKLVSVKLKRSVLYVYNKNIVILCILYILETAEFDKQLSIGRIVKFQINDVTSAHWPAYYMKTWIITKTLILQ